MRKIFENVYLSRFSDTPVNATVYLPSGGLIRKIYDSHHRLVYKKTRHRVPSMGLYTEVIKYRYNDLDSNKFKLYTQYERTVYKNGEKN